MRRPTNELDAAEAARSAVVSDPLERLATIADDAGAPAIAREAREIADRTSNGRFYVACVGQFKRGKSTLINALVGDAVLPTGVVPVTNVPTVLRYGSRRSARVRLRGEPWRDIQVADLEHYVSEAQNPENAREVEIVEVLLPSPILAGGLCFVDTPGIGSVFEGNTAAAHAFIPQIDVALLVIGSEPPLAGDELALVEALAGHVQRFIVVLGKADRSTDAERAAASAFARQVLATRLGHAIGRVYEVSAIQHLSDDSLTGDWGALVAAIATLAGHSSTLAAAARNRARARIERQLVCALEAERAALLRSVEQARRHRDALDTVITQAEQALVDLDAQFFREQRQLVRELAARRDRFLADVGPDAHRDLRSALVAARRRRRWGPGARREAMDAALDVARRLLLPWLDAEQRVAEAGYRRVGRRFVAMANEFLARLASTDAAELAQLPTALDVEQHFRSRSRFYFLDLLWIAHPASPLRYVMDIALGAVGAARSLEREAHAFLSRVLETNAERVQNDLSDQLSENRRRLEGEIGLLLRGVRAVAEHALDKAQRTQREGEGAVRDAVERIARQIEAVRATHDAGQVTPGLG